MKLTGMLVVSLRGCKLQILVSLRVFKKESQNFYPYRYRLGLCEKKYLYEKTRRRPQSLASVFSAIKITVALIWLSVLAWSPLGVK